MTAALKDHFPAAKGKCHLAVKTMERSHVSADAFLWRRRNYFFSELQLSPINKWSVVGAVFSAVAALVSTT
jgi:hypothetical protein